MNVSVLGIDVGTSAVRAAVVDLNGEILANAAVPLPPTTGCELRKEQHGDDWWEKTVEAIKKITSFSSVDTEKIAAIAVDATSGTIVPVDEKLQTLAPAMMYNDSRAAGYGDKINSVAGNFIKKHGYKFKDNFALSRALWLKDNAADFDCIHKILHQGDFINAKLMGKVPATDWSTALKTGCDLFECQWPDFIAQKLNLPLDKLPEEIVAPGTVIGEISSECARMTGLVKGIKIVAGASDGTASLFASGAGQLGDYCTCLGSTITIKGIAAEIINDPEGVIYCHRHPAGHWLPGGASNVGCTAINTVFANFAEDGVAILEKLGANAVNYLPSDIMVYPLVNFTEERFPIRKSGIRGFVNGEFSSLEELYAAYLQGIAFVERWCYEKLAELGAEAKKVFTTGGGSSSGQWNQIRADVLGLPLLIPENTETVLGAAVLAASELYGNLPEAIQKIIKIKAEVQPSGKDYNRQYKKFRYECEKRFKL